MLFRVRAALWFFHPNGNRTFRKQKRALLLIILGHKYRLAWGKVGHMVTFFMQDSVGPGLRHLAENWEHPDRFIVSSAEMDQKSSGSGVSPNACLRSWQVTCPLWMSVSSSVKWGYDNFHIRGIVKMRREELREYFVNVVTLQISCPFLKSSLINVLLFYFLKFLQHFPNGLWIKYLYIYWPILSHSHLTYFWLQ